MKTVVLLLAAASLLFFIARYTLSEFGSPREVATELSAGLSRTDMADRIGEGLAWGKQEKAEFLDVYAQMQWASFNTEIARAFASKFDWGKIEREAFLTLSAKYFEPKFDFLADMYVPGSYVLTSDESAAAIAEALIDRVRTSAGKNIMAFVEDHIDENVANAAAKLVQNEVELLPDLVPFPAKDIVLEKGDGAVYLRFSTIYFNQGKGPLELRADPATRGVKSDIERDVLQRIYRKDGSWRDRAAGTFLWHQPHLHYHFADFVVYDLEAVDVKEEAPDLSGVRQKSTFCVRDISRVEMELEHRARDAAYKICGKELQGISVGWGDTYFFSYPDQLLNVVDLPSGIYRLMFIVNPSGRFEELKTDNNRSSVLLSLDMKNLNVKVLEEEPKNMPKLEHVYPEQEFE